MIDNIVQPYPGYLPDDTTETLRERRSLADCRNCRWETHGSYFDGTLRVHRLVDILVTVCDEHSLIGLTPPTSEA